MNVLSKCNVPADLQNLEAAELLLLCDELRTFIIDSVSQTGGHFAANLGVIELTVALHHVFNTPYDRLIWDVGHQAYPHKVLTGRKSAFVHLRKWGGISGFPKRQESEYDAFGVGHSSTSLSALAGMMVANRLSGQNRKHIAVIGDGALSAGQAFEALNNIGFLSLPCLIVLNDNHIGIDPVSGALNDYLAGLSEGTENLFTRLGFDYYGPIDGHNLPELIEKIRSVKDAARPVLLHVKTLKGKGFSPAEAEQTRWHATAGFDKVNPLAALPSKPGLKFQDVAGKTLLGIAQQDPKVVAITPAMISGSSLHYMQEQFPERVFDVGIAEQHAVTFAAGLATEGYKPFCFLYSTFLQRAVDQIIHDVCLQQLPVIFCIDRAGLVGEDGPTHHGNFDSALLLAIPDLILMAPSSLHELEMSMKWAHEHATSTVCIRYPRGVGMPRLNTPVPPVNLGESYIVQEGNTFLFLSYGAILTEVIQLSELMQQQGYTPCIVDIRFLKPLHTEFIVSLLCKFKVVCTFENQSVVAGLGSEVSKIITEHATANQLISFGIPDTFVSHGSQSVLLQECGLSSNVMWERIARECQL